MPNAVRVDQRQGEADRRQLALLYRLVCGASANAGGTPRYNAAAVQVVADWGAVAQALVERDLARWSGPDMLEATEAGARRVADDLRARGLELLPHRTLA